MPKSKPLSQKEKDIKRFIQLTWEVVRRNPEYRVDYRKFLQNYGLTPEDMKPKKSESGRTISSWAPPVGGCKLYFNFETGRYVLEYEKPDPKRCNLAYMMQRWGVADSPDATTPLGALWLVPFSKWPEIMQKVPIARPLTCYSLLDAQLFLQKMPGVLEVERWPDFKATSKSIQKYDDVCRLLSEGRGPKNKQERLEYEEAFRFQWEIEDPPLLTITINLRAPSWLIDWTFEFLRAVCKVELKLRGKDIEWSMIPTYLQAWDMWKQGLSDDEISKRIPLKRTRPKEQIRADIAEEYKEADREINSKEYYNITRIREYI
jgi:hypothetical protein